MRDTRRWITAVAGILLIAPILIGAKSKSASITIDDMQFSPSSVDIKVGDTVTWTNNDDRDHTVVSRDGSFKSENLRPGSSYTYQFNKAGRFEYSCSYHPRMKGMVNVADK
ncbi:MAG TPA: cupredoxin family copper-binding protein [Tepidisphaeraceae bacterium]|jgi:plastocyanin